MTGETWLGPAAAVVQDITPASMRAFAIAVYYTINTLIGGVGPLVVGALLGDDGLCTRHYGYVDGVKYALLFVMPVCYVLSAALFAWAGAALALRHRRHLSVDD